MLEQAMQFLIKNVFEDYVNGLERSKGSGGACEFNNLTLKVQKINDELDEDGNSPFSIDSGKVAMVSLQPTWLGGVNLKIDGLEIGLSFNAIKAFSMGMSALTGNADEVSGDPSDAEREKRQPQGESMADRRRPLITPPGAPPLNRGQQYLTPGAPGAQSSTQPTIPASQAAQQMGSTSAHLMYGSGVLTGGQQFCHDHQTSEQRAKGASSVKPCMSCKQTLQTNYIQFAYCPKCSGAQSKCMICGTDTISRGPSSPSGASRHYENQNNGAAHHPSKNGFDKIQEHGTPSSRMNGRGGPPPPPMRNGSMVPNGTVMKRALVSGRRRDDCPSGRSTNVNRTPRDMQVDSADYATPHPRRRVTCSEDSDKPLFSNLFGATSARGSTDDQHDEGIFSRIFGTPMSGDRQSIGGERTPYQSSDRNGEGIYSSMGRGTRGY